MSRPRALGRTALACEVSGSAKSRVVLEAGPGSAGLYLLTRAEAATLAALRPDEPEGRARQALLLFRKHVDGLRIGGVRRISGERHLLVECGDVTLSLRLWGAPALTLVAGDRALATLGRGREAWPLPDGDPRRDTESLRGSVEPTLSLPAPLADLADADLAGERALAIGPVPGPSSSGAAVLTLHSWREAFARFLELRARGDAFAALRRERLAEARRELKRLRSLERHLAEDARAQADPDLLRRQAEALLAAPSCVPPGAREAALPDPYEPARTIRVELAPALDAVANAERLFVKARRIARARTQVAARLLDARAQRGVAEERLLRVEAARRIADLSVPSRASRRAPAAPASVATGKRHYLTSRGLSLHVGRGAKENHRLTFELARPEDLWFHARDTPGAHVILRDDQGRTTAEDRREAAEVAAFFSDAAGATAVDVHCARRKHLRPGKGGPGRVRVGHSETLRVSPRDPEGRLRRR